MMARHLAILVWVCGAMWPALALAQFDPRATDIALEPGQYESGRSVAGVHLAVRIHDGAAAGAKQAVATALDEMERAIKDYAVASRTSPIHSINANADRDEVVVDPQTGLLLQRAIDVCRRTGGAYDPTAATFDYLWNFRTKPFVAPLPQEIAVRVKMAGCKNLVLKANHIVRLLQTGLRVTLQPVARAFALDRAAATLRAANVNDFRILADGQVYVQGRMGTRHWFAVVPNGRVAGRAAGQLFLSSHAAITRTDSDVFAVRADRRYHDVLDVRQGRPAQGVVQTTVIGAEPAVAAMLAEALFVLGPKAGLAMLAKERGVEGFVVDGAGKIHASKGLGDLARLPATFDLGLPPPEPK